MKPEAVVRELDRLARAIGFTVRTERGRFRGGSCRLDETRVVVLNRAHPPEMNAALLADALVGADLGGLFVPPVLRRMIDEAAARRAAGTDPGEWEVGEG